MSRLDGRHDGRELRHADSGDDARRADGTGSDADLDGVGAGVDQRLRALGGRNVAGHDAHGIRQLLGPGDGVEHALRVAVRGIDDEQIDAGIDQPLSALETVIADAGGGRDAKPPLSVLGGVRVQLRLLAVLDGDEADAVVVGVHDEELLDAALVQQTLGLVRVDALADRNEIVVRHQFRHLLRRIGSEADVAVGQDADEAAGDLAPAAAVLDHRDAGDPIGAHQRPGIGQGSVRADGHRIDDHAGLELLDLANLLGLLYGSEIPMDDAHAASLGHGDGQAGLGDGVHGRRQDRDVELDVAGDARPDIGFTRHDFGVARLKQDVVEGERQRACGRIDDLCHCRSL